MLTRTWNGWAGAMAAMADMTRDRSVRAGVSDAASEPDPAWASADDRALVEACLAGRRDAFDPIVERHRRSIYQLCYRFVGNHEDASDLTQDVFIRAYRGLRHFKGQSSLGTWLYRIGVNVCLNRLALKTPRPEPLDAREPADTRLERADAAVMREERAATVRAAIATLPRTQRATLILRVYHELTHEQIAGILGSSVGAVKANFFHALRNLRKRLPASAAAPLQRDTQ
jgi:RNA polymerase sigma-70 factor, ECF subfamily